MLSQEARQYLLAAFDFTGEAVDIPGVLLQEIMENANDETLPLAERRLDMEIVAIFG
jgi:hypothetical protein